MDVRTYFIELIRESPKKDEDICVCEIGSGNGDTSSRVIDVIGKYGCYYYFDYESKVNKLRHTLMKGSKVNAFGFGNTTKTYDSYAWSVSKLYLEMKKYNLSSRIFDYVFVDGSNILLHDLSTMAIIVKMLREDAVVVVNNTEWSFEKSKHWNPKNNEVTKTILSDEQITASHNDMLCKLMFEEDDYVLIAEGNNYKAYRYCPKNRLYVESVKSTLRCTYSDPPI